MVRFLFQFPGLIILLCAAVLQAEGVSSSTGKPWWERTDHLPDPDIAVSDVIDRLINERLAKLDRIPAPPAPPETLLRRATLDLHGRIPTVVETEAFLKDTSLSRWENRIGDLLVSPAFDRFLAHELNWLLMDGKTTDFQKYLSLAVSGRVPWDVIFSDSITGLENGEELKGVDFFLRDRVKDSDQMTNDVSVKFFGVNISCAQCHDHPYVKDWTQETYYGMRAYFSRTFENGGFVGEKEYGELNYKTNDGVEKKASLRFLGGEPLAELVSVEPSAEEQKTERAVLEEFKKKKKAPSPPEYSRRSRLIEAALGGAQEEWMARSLVNRTWYRLFGFGLVMPLDQMHGENAPSHPELLQWLARDLIDHGYDMRRLIGGIVQSETYQRDSKWGNGPRPDRSEFSVAHPRPLAPRQYAVALKFGATRASQFGGDLDPVEFARRVESTERSGAGLARWFARPGENFHIAVDEALLLSNSGEIGGQLFNAGLRDEIEALPTNREKISLAYRSLLVREPDADELATIDQYLVERSDRPRQAVEQMLWAIMAGTEARFNH